MLVQTVSSPIVSTEADAMVVGLHADESPSGAAAEFDQAAGGLLSRLIEAKECSAKAGDTTLLFAPPGVRAPLVLVVGLGPRAKLDRGVAFTASAAAAKKLAAKSRQRVAYFLDGTWPPECTEAGVCGALVGCHGQDLYRAEKNLFPFAELAWAGNAAAVTAGRVLGEAVNLTRRLVNEPPQDVYPESFARRAEVLAAERGLAAEIWDQDRLTAERCGSLLAVAKGSARPPRLVILKYSAAAPDTPLLALVGKGVCFDSGGLSLKSNESMLTMKCDMAGAATVLGALQAIAELKLPVNVIGLMGLVENMPSGTAMKLGDILTARSGKTIEVLNTDAEGRLVLADVLNVAVERGASKIIDLATLTGSCVVALGEDVAGVMTNDQPWCDAVIAAARTCGEPVWQLPMFDDYRDQIKSQVADIKNVGNGRWGGAITAAKFLEEFVAGKPWVHFDIAGPAFLDKPKPWIDAGASGALVRTLVEVARSWR